MAEIDTSGGKGKKVSTKVDMTPMVDLAFLLITFFMLTTTFSKPQAMEINMPDKNDKNETVKVKQSKTITIVLGPNDRIFYYQGVNDPAVEPLVQETKYSSNDANAGIRDVLLKKKQEIGEGIIVIIKAQEKSNYKNVVDIMDEMAITSIGTYALVDITPQDNALIKKQKGV